MKKARFDYFLLLFCVVISLFSSCKATKLQGINTIIDYSRSGVIYLKKGVHYLHEPLVLSSNTKIVGNKTTIRLRDHQVFPIIVMSSIENVELSGVKIEGLPLVNTDNHDKLKSYNYNYAVRISDSDNISIKDCSFENLEGTSIKVLDSSNVSIFNCQFENIGLPTRKGVPYSYDAIYLGGSSYIKDVLIDSCKFLNIGDAFNRGNSKWPNDGDGVHILTSGKASYIKITNSIFEKCSARGVKIQSGDGVWVENNTFERCGSAVMMPMNQDLQDIYIRNNKIFKTNISLGTDKHGQEAMVTNLVIKSNYTDQCNHFFRTSGSSIVRLAQIDSNHIGSTSKFVISGRFIDSRISSNFIGQFGTANDKSWNMGIMILPKSKNVEVVENSFGVDRPGTRMLDIRSKNRITTRNNFKNKDIKK